MEKITFECEVITPMFLAGANGRTPELRPPSIKGAMRFWWRAINANLVENKNGKCDYTKLIEEEAKIFGSSDEKVGKSKFSIRIMSTILNYKDYSPVPHSTKTFKFAGINPNQTFQIILKPNEKQFRNILEITLLLGSLGKRSRRGFGSVKINKINSIIYNSPSSLQELINLLNKIHNNFKINSNKIDLIKPNSADYPYIKEIQLGKSYSSSEELLKGIGQTTHDKNQRSKTHLGSANPRQSSPIYISTLKITDNDFRPLITTLNTALENGHSLSTQQI
ncbi:MAG: type III-B CRISPR module RAMP protein Cmr1, partial [Cyanobacteriota bacterium]